MNFIEAILFGLISGLTEFLPISAQAHQALFVELFGIDVDSLAFSSFLNHLAVALALYTCCRDSLKNLYKEMLLSNRSKRHRSRQPNRRSICDIAFIKSAFYPLAFGFFCYPFASRILDDLQWISLFLLINGIILFIPPYIRTGNKDSLSMTRLDGFAFGLAGGLGIIPGISRVAACTAVGSIQGAERNHTLHWTLLLSIPAIAFMLGFDARDMLLNGLGIDGLSGLLVSIIGALFAYLGATFGIQLMRFLSVKAGYSGFSYYCWGAALFAFVLFLI